MNPDDEKIVMDYRGAFDAPVEVTLAALGNAVGRRMSDFCSHLTRLIPEIQIRNAVPGSDGFPAIYPSTNIGFHLIPEGKLMKIFLMAIDPKPPERTIEKGIPTEEINRRIRLPAGLKIYVAPTCPFCPQVVLQGLCLAQTSPLIDLSIIDVTVFKELADADRIRSVPTTILDNRFRWTGLLDLEELVRTLEKRTPDILSAETMEKMIADGRADNLARLLIDFHMFPPGLIDVILHEKWPVRLGAMVVFEYIAEADAHMAESLINLLWRRFPDVADTIKGDILHLFSIYGQPSVLTKLKGVINGHCSNEIKDIAKEVMLEITKENQDESG